MKCSICKRPLDVAGDPYSLDCGGDCARCMADAGDPALVELVQELQSRGVLDYPPEFIGDGRHMVTCPHTIPGGRGPLRSRPEGLTRAQARAHIDRLAASRCSAHSPLGATLWVTLRYCQWNNLPHRVTVDGGYYVELL